LYGGLARAVWVLFSWPSNWRSVNRPVAIKVLRRKLLEDPDFPQRFQDEASSTGRIRHQNVVTVHECGQTDDGSPYIAMEYLEGESLRQILRRRGTLPLPETAEILKQAARGLNAAHKLGIIHRDLKPDNIFLTHDDDGKPLVKIVDFGIAKMREANTHTVTGGFLGTPAYMSVEQASGMRSDDLDGRSDIYSLGIVTYEMIAGRAPFQADTPMAYLKKHLIEPPPPLRQTRPDLRISRQLDEVVMKALRKERDERHPTTIEFAREFGLAVSAAAETLNVASAASVPKVTEEIRPAIVVVPPLRFPAKYKVAAGALAAVVALGCWYGLSNKTPKKPAPTDQTVLAAPASEPPKQTPSEVVPHSEPSQKPEPATAHPTPDQFVREQITKAQSPAPVAAQRPSNLGATAPGGATHGDGRGHSQHDISAEDRQQFIGVFKDPSYFKESPEQKRQKLSSLPLFQRMPPAERNQIIGGLLQPKYQSMIQQRLSQISGDTSPNPPAPSQKSALSSRESQPDPDAARKVKAATALGDLHYNRGEYDEAIAEYKRGLEADPSNAVLRTKIDRAEKAKAAEQRLNQ
jgi:serine/threonine-protein kinase